MIELTFCSAKAVKRSTVMLLFMAFFVAGCMDNPAKWPPERIATNVAKTLEISGLTLTPGASGTESGSGQNNRLEGTGKRLDGETLTVVVTLHPDTYEYRYEAKGDRGFVETGKYILEQVR